jgi:hypothetical protein
MKAISGVRRACLWLLLTVLSAGACAAAGGGSQGLVGGVYVKTDPPGATISVFRQERGTSPCRLPNVGIGNITIVATKKGYREASKEVEVTADKLTKVELTMEKLHGVGHLLVKVKPDGSRVLVDRTPRGQTPAEVINLAAGTHRVTVSREGYHDRSRLVKIFPGRRRTISGRLEPRKDPGGGSGGLTVQTGGQKGPLRASEMPEERTFEPVRERVSEGRLDEALAKLDDIADGEKGARYATRIARDRVVIGFMRRVREAAWQGLRKKAGDRVTIPLENGVSFTGRLVGVESDSAKIELSGSSRTTTIKKGDIRPAEVVELASGPLDPEEPRNMARFAAYYAGRGMLEKASKLLKKARKAGSGAVEVRSYIRTERMWRKAKKAEEKQKASRRKSMQRKRQEQAESPPLVLIHAAEDSFQRSEIRRGLTQRGVSLLRETEPFVGRDLWEADAVVLGAADRPNVLNRREMERAVQFVRSGGGLVVLTTKPPESRVALRKGAPVARLLQAFNISVPDAKLRVKSKTPKGIPRDGLLCTAGSGHPVVRGVQRVLFSSGSPPLILRGSGTPLLVTHRFVKGGPGSAPYVLAAALQQGGGRVVVFSREPTMGENARGRQAREVVVRAILWAAGGG